MTDDDTTDNDDPYIVELGAGERGAPDSINFDVSNTTGPDHLGQETVDVDGHWADKPGVRSRLPENSPDHGRIRRMDTGCQLPVLLSSNMSTDPVEGVQGTYSYIETGECVRCGYDRLKVAVATLAGEHSEECMACGAKQGHRSHEQDDRPYTMPTTPKERADDERDAGDVLTELSGRTLVDLEASTGSGPYVSLVGRTNVVRLRKTDVAEMFAALVNDSGPDGANDALVRLRNELGDLRRLYAASLLLPDDLAVTKDDEDTEDDD